MRSPLCGRSNNLRFRIERLPIRGDPRPWQRHPCTWSKWEVLVRIFCTAFLEPNRSLFAGCLSISVHLPSPVPENCPHSQLLLGRLFMRLASRPLVRILRPPPFSPLDPRVIIYCPPTTISATYPLRHIFGLLLTCLLITTTLLVLPNLLCPISPLPFQPLSPSPDPTFMRPKSGGIRISDPSPSHFEAPLLPKKSLTLPPTPIRPPPAVAADTQPGLPDRQTTSNVGYF